MTKKATGAFQLIHFWIVFLSLYEILFGIITDHLVKAFMNVLFDFMNRGTVFE